jgi:hypothetical protein
LIGLQKKGGKFHNLNKNDVDCYVILIVGEELVLTFFMVLDSSAPFALVMPRTWPLVVDIR